MMMMTMPTVIMNIFCNHSGILNQLMIDKFRADIKRTKT